MKQQVRVWACVMGLLLGGTVFLGSNWANAGGGYEPLMKGSVAKARIERVTQEIDWKRDLDSTLAAAKEANKPVLWLQLVGDLDDGL